jgi:hypothetical protein
VCRRPHAAGRITARTAASMPRQADAEAVRAVQEAHPDTPVIAISA